MSSSGITSFWKQDQSYWQSMASLNQDLTTSTSTISKLFAAASGASSSNSTTPNLLSAYSTSLNSTSVINGFGQAQLNYDMNAAVLAAQEGNDRVNQQTAQANGQLTTAPAGDLSNQVTWSGALSVNFGKDGPAMGGGYQFKSGSDLQSAFNTAVGAYTSEGEAIDSYAVVGNTLTAGTSGTNAHAVFTLTLHPDSGLYTFQMFAPIDETTTKGNYKPVYLNGLMQAVSSTGQKLALPSVEMDVYNDLGDANGQGNWGLLHEASLTYNEPSSTTSTSSSSSTTSNGSSSSSASGSLSSSTSSSSASTSTTYKAPTDPRTNYAYTANPSAAAALVNTVNLFS